MQSLVALWLFSKFGLSLAAAGLFFFWSGVLAAFSFPAAAWLAGRIGLINTMVYTHIPSSLCLILAAVVAESRARARAAAGALGAVADGCADALVLCDGRRHAARAAGGGQPHVGAAQPRRGGKPRHRGRAVRGGLAACRS